MKPIWITEGDPCGISYDLLQGSLAELRKASESRAIILIRSQSKWLPSGFAEWLDERLPENGLHHRTHNILSVEEENSLKIGLPSVTSGKVAFHSFLAGIRMQKKWGGSLLTMPLSKEWVIRSGQSDFRGHTEELAKAYGKKTIMLMNGKSLKVIPLTTHIPLSSVREALQNLDVSSLADSILQNDSISRTRIGFLGLNPHAGEHGLVGNEEEEILEPIIHSLRKSGLEVEGPLPADSAFALPMREQYGLFLACYHDQGLIPFKMWEGKEGINETLGLGFVRVSPDHGTAFTIAGKNVADNTSFLQCLERLSL